MSIKTKANGNRYVSTDERDGVKYGISDSDIRWATGSSKRDVVLLHCESQESVGDDTEDEYISKGDTKIKSAFALGDMSVPTGWTKHAKTGRTKGDLVVVTDGTDGTERTVAVARPRWNLWADHVNFGKFVVNSGTAQSPNYHYRYNIFCPFNGHPLEDDGTPVMPNGTGQPNLEQWQGYSPQEVHEPSFKVTGFPNGLDYAELEFHNGVYADLRHAGQRFPLNGASVGDHGKIFIEDRAALANAEMSLGNLIDWEASYNEKEPTNSIRLATMGTNGFVFDENGLAIYGIAVDAKINRGAASELSIASVAEYENAPLGKGSTASIKNKYLGSISSVLEYRCEYGGALYNMMNYYDKVKVADATLSLVASPKSVPLKNASLVDTASVIPTSGIKFQSDNDDKRVSTSTNKRFIFANGGKVKIDGKVYTVCWGNGVSDSAAQFDPLRRGSVNYSGSAGNPAGTYYYGLGFFVFLYCEADGTVLSTDKLGAMVEITTTESTPAGKPNIGYYRRMYFSCPKVANFDNSTIKSVYMCDPIWNKVYGTSLCPNGSTLASKVGAGNAANYVYPIIATDKQDLNLADALVMPSELNIDNTTLVITFFDRTASASVDVYAGNYNAGAIAKTYRRNGLSFTGFNGYIVWQRNQYAPARAIDPDGNAVYDLGYVVPANSTTQITGQFDFLVYSNSDVERMDAQGTLKVVLRNNGVVVNQNVSTQIGYREITIDENINRTMLDSTGQTFSVNIKSGHNRPAATSDGWYQAVATCHRFSFSGLHIRPGDNYTFSIEP